MENEERLSEKESLALITSMIQRVKSSNASCFTPFKYDMLVGAIVAMSCWFIPGIILLKRYNQQKKVNV